MTGNFTPNAHRDELLPGVRAAHDFVDGPDASNESHDSSVAAAPLATLSDFPAERAAERTSHQGRESTTPRVGRESDDEFLNRIIKGIREDVLGETSVEPLHDIAPAPRVAHDEWEPPFWCFAAGSI